MRISPLLIISGSLNVLLAAALLVGQYSGSSSTDTSIGVTAATASGGAAEHDPAKLVALARRHGASDQLAYRIALAAARAATGTAIPAEYWKPAPERAAASREAEYKSTQAARELLLRSFGPAAKDQPAFFDLFQPDRERLPFLSADKQMALQQILFETSNGGLTFARAEKGTDDERSTRIRALLSEEELAEYQLRESPAAVRLANIGFDFTEQEFRAVYDVLNAGQERPAGVRSLRAATPEIERVLGAARFQEFKRAQDPIYRWLRAAAQQFGVTQEAVTAAFELIKDTQKRAAGAGSGSSGATARVEMLAARDRQLKAQLGEKMFAYVAPQIESSDAPRASWPGDAASAFRPVR